MNITVYKDSYKENETKLKKYRINCRYMNGAQINEYVTDTLNNILRKYVFNEEDYEHIEIIDIDTNELVSTIVY